MPNYRQIKAIEAENKKRLLRVNPYLSERSGIYILFREDEEGFKYAYIGQAKHVLNRLAQHLTGYQHIDLSLKKHRLYSDENKTGWNVIVHYCTVEELDEREQFYIKEYANSGYQLRNKTSGSQGVGKKQIDEYRPTKGYRDGLAQGRKNASKEIANLFDKHLNVSTKKEPPTINQQKALEKFEEFLKYHKEQSKNE